MKMKSKHRLRRLRLELLETRSLLSAAPWSTLDHNIPHDRVHGFELDSPPLHRLAHGADDRGGPSQFDRGRPPRGESPRVRVASAADRPTSLGKEFGARDAGSPSRWAPLPASAMQTGFTSETVRVTTSGQSNNTQPVTSQRDPISSSDAARQVVQTLERSTVLVVRLVPTTLVFTRIVDTPASHGQVGTVDVASQARDEGAARTASQNGQPIATPADAMLPSGSTQAYPLNTLDSGLVDMRLADVNSPQFGTVDFAYDASSSGSDSRADWRGLRWNDQPGFESAWLHLFSDSAKQEQVAELDELLETLAQDNASESSGSLPSLTDDGRQWQPGSFLHPAERAAIVDQLSGREEMDGMIAMDLPGDLLLQQNELLDREPGSAAWTARVGIYRPHGMAAAHGGAAVVSRPVNATRSNANSENELQADEAIVARLRPVIAATSAAFGAIFIGLRKQRHKLRDQLLNSQKLS